MGVEREAYGRMAAAMEECRRIEDEENECEINYLLQKMHNSNSQDHQTFMPYIS